MFSQSISLARKLRAEQTSSEALIWNAVRGRRFEGFKFRRQVPVGTFITDFCCRDAMLILEVDVKHHGEQVEKDEARAKFLEERGFLLLRFTNEKVRGRLDWVMTETGRALDLARARGPRTPWPRID